VSQASAQAFLEQIGKDPALRAALRALSSGTARNMRASGEALVILAGRFGFDFNQQELKAACSASVPRDASELDDGALDDVAGGASQDALVAARFSLTIDGCEVVRFPLAVRA
jgi:predicted ribosomally synthesized peptide with nif11-like leader